MRRRRRPERRQRVVLSEARVHDARKARVDEQLAHTVEHTFDAEGHDCARSAFAAVQLLAQQTRRLLRALPERGVGRLQELVRHQVCLVAPVGIRVRIVALEDSTSLEDAQRDVVARDALVHELSCTGGSGERNLISRT